MKDWISALFIAISVFNLISRWRSKQTAACVFIDALAFLLAVSSFYFILKPNYFFAVFLWVGSFTAQMGSFCLSDQALSRKEIVVGVAIPIVCLCGYCFAIFLCSAGQRFSHIPESKPDAIVMEKVDSIFTDIAIIKKQLAK